MSDQRMRRPQPDMELGQPLALPTPEVQDSMPVETVMPLNDEQPPHDGNAEGAMDEPSASWPETADGQPLDTSALENQELLEIYCRSRNVEMRNQLLQRYLYIAEIVAKKFVNRGVDYDDLFQVASLALLRALERFEPDKGYKFSSFATPTLVGEIKNYFRDRTRMIRISRSDIDLMKRMDYVSVEMSQNMHRAPTPEEIADELGITTEKVLLLLEQRNSANITSLDSTVDEVGDTPLVELLGKDETNYASIENRDFLNRVLNTLDATSRYIIEQRFFQNKSQREVARSMNVSQMYISRTERKLLQKFRTILEEK